MNFIRTLLILSFAVSALAADKNPSAFTRTITTDRADCIYQRGEPFTFTISVSLRGVAGQRREGKVDALERRQGHRPERYT